MKTELELLFEAIRCYGGPEAEQYARQNNEFPSALCVSDMFSWDETPQGYRYWYELSYKAYKYNLRSPHNQLTKQIKYKCSEPHLAEYVRQHGETPCSDRLIEQFAFIDAPYETAFYYIARKFGELPPSPDEPAPTAEPVEPGKPEEPELWWQTRDREAREQRDRIIALRNAIRDIHGL